MPVPDSDPVTTSSRISAFTLLGWVWGIGIAGFTFAHAFRVRRFLYLLRAAEGPDVALLELGDGVAERLGLKSVPQIVTLPVRLAPLVWSFGFKLRVVLPATLLEQLDAAAQEAILAHESAHVRRKDDWVRVVDLVVVTLFWWHPVAWWACRELRILEEQCCDELVLSTVPHGAKAYATALLDTLDFLSEKPISAPVLTTTAMCRVSLTRRIEMLKNHPCRVPLTFGRLMLLLTLAAAPMAVCFATEPPQTADPPASGHETSAKEPIAEAGGKVQQKGVEANEAAKTSKPLITPAAGKNFLIVPFSTELQRAYQWSYENARLFILINGMALFNDADTVLDTSSLDFLGIEAALLAYYRAGMDMKGASIVVRIIGVPIRKQDDMASVTASGLLCGYFRNHGWTGSDNRMEMILRNPQRPVDWDRLVAQLSEVPTQDAIHRESGVGDDLVMVYPIRTPLSRYLVAGGDREYSVLRSVKPFDELTPNEIAAFGKLAKRYLARLDLGEPPITRFVWNGGKSITKGNLAARQLREGLKVHGVKLSGTTLWTAGKQRTTPLLVIRLAGEAEIPIEKAKITAAFPSELKTTRSVRFEQREDGRWRSRGLTGHEDFTLTVEAPGYKSQSQKLNLPWDTTKELEVKLQKE